MEHAEGAPDPVEVLREERQRLGDTEPRPEENGEQRAVADAGWGAQRTGGTEGFDVGKEEGFGGETTCRSPPSGRDRAAFLGHQTSPRKPSVGLSEFRHC